MSVSGAKEHCGIHTQAALQTVSSDVVTKKQGTCAYLVVSPADVQIPVLLGSDADGVRRDVLALGQDPRRRAGRALALVTLRALLGLSDPVVQRPDLRLLLLAVLLVLLVGLIASTEESSASEETTADLHDEFSPLQRERWRVASLPQAASCACRRCRTNASPSPPSWADSGGHQNSL